MNATYGSVFLDKRKERNGRKLVAARTRKINFIFGNFDRSFMKMPRTLKMCFRCVSIETTLT